MDKEVKARWLEALKSGKYRKARKRLRNKKGGMCCLGVLCDVAGLDWHASGYATHKSIAASDAEQLPYDFAEEIGMSWDDQQVLIAINDHNPG